MYTIYINNGGTDEVLHEPDANSLRRLASGTFTSTVGQKQEAELVVYPQNPAFDQLHELTTLVRIHNEQTGADEFEGRVIKVSEYKMTQTGEVSKKVICEGLLAYLCDSIQPYHLYDGGSVSAFLTALLSEHNSQMPPDKQITLGQCDSFGGDTTTRQTVYRSTLEEISENLVKTLGGELRIRKVAGVLYLDYVEQYGSRRDTTLELAKNIKAISTGSDATTVITRLLPLGKQLSTESPERLTIADAVLRTGDGEAITTGDGQELQTGTASPYIDDPEAMEVYGVITGKVEFDDVDNPTELYAKGLAYLQQNNRKRRTFAATVLDLSTIMATEGSIQEGDTYPCICPAVGLDEELRIIKKRVDIYKPYAPEIEIGDKLERITSVAARTVKLLEYELPQAKIDTLVQAKATATNLIKGGITGGYVVTTPNEILIMDTTDPETATRVWRWNAGGFGYSRTGYEGTYETAMTMDGAIVADFITAGTLTGIQINNGSGTFKVDPNGAVLASAINITGGSINIETTSETNDVIQLKYKGINASKFSPFGFEAVWWNGSNNVKTLSNGRGFETYLEGSLTSQVVAQTGHAFYKRMSADVINTTASGFAYDVGAAIKDIYSRLAALGG